MSQRHAPMCNLSHHDQEVRWQGCNCTGYRPYPPPTEVPITKIASKPACRHGTPPDKACGVCDLNMPEHLFHPTPLPAPIDTRKSLNPFKDLLSTSPPTVVPTIPNIRNIPERLRTLADTIELDNLENAGPESAIVVMVCAGGRIDVRAFGVCHDKLHATGILAAGMGKLTE